MAKKYLIFNHIPKCGGTSFRHMFFDACQDPNNFFYKKPIYISCITHNNLILDGRDKDKIECAKLILHPKTCLFIDHCKYMSLENIFNLNPLLCYRVISIRHPIDRILSYNNVGGGEHSRSILYSVDELLNNEQSLINMINSYGFFLMNYATLNCSNTINEKYNMAKNIYKNNYNFIFDLDNLDKYIELFNSKNPFNLKLKNIHKNKTEIKKNYPIELIKKIEKLIEPEINLYFDIKNII
jgi:hypothetical protein